MFRRSSNWEIIEEPAHIRGGASEINEEFTAELEDNGMKPMDIERLDQIQQGWILGHGQEKIKKKYVNLGCTIMSHKMAKWLLFLIVLAAITCSMIVTIPKVLPKNYSVELPDNYTVALHKALQFFDAQKSGVLSETNNISWRGNSGLRDGISDPSVSASLPEKDLVGGYYDAGDHIKFGFPGAFTITMLSWSVIEYGHKYEGIGELDHIKELIKWGTDYMLKTFNASAVQNINVIYSQVGSAISGSSTPDDHYCWMRPEDMTYPRPVLQTTAGPDLAGEMAAALAAASIVFRDNAAYSKKLVRGADLLYSFARDGQRRTRYSYANPHTSQFYNSSGYFDEYVWGAAWLYFATGNKSYLQLATLRSLAEHAGAFSSGPYSHVFSWDNKLPGAQVLLARLRIFLSPGYPYEEMLEIYHKQTDIFMCSFLPLFEVFNRTKGGLILLNNGNPQSLQYVVNAAFLASLYNNYLNTAGVPGFYCGSNFFPKEVLRSFAKFQVDYILGRNPESMSYVVGYGRYYPMHVHHRAASIPKNNVKYSCTGGYKWRDIANPNPHMIIGAMVGGPDKYDHFNDSRCNYNQTEPTIVGNAGLVAALVALSGGDNLKVDKNTLFSAIPSMFPLSPPPPSPWNP